jgi:hypothetical protein
VPETAAPPLNSTNCVCNGLVGVFVFRAVLFPALPGKTVAEPVDDQHRVIALQRGRAAAPDEVQISPWG